VPGAAAPQPHQNEPPYEDHLRLALAEPLSRDVLFLPYRAENLHIVPVFGPGALTVSLRIGHIHVTVDDAT
jgi:hypothetical protein